MIGAILKQTIKRINKNRINSLLTIVGLILGVFSFIGISILIKDDLSYDRFHEGSDKIYRVCREHKTNGYVDNSASTSFPLAEALNLSNEHLIKSFVRLYKLDNPSILVERILKDKSRISFNEKNFFFADSSFFDVFSFKLIAGDKTKVLAKPNSIVITQTMANKYFGNTSPLGQILLLEEAGYFEVTGIIQDLPQQSHIKFDCLISMETVKLLFGGQLLDNWQWNPCWTYVLLKNQGDNKILESNFPDFIEKHYFDFEKKDITLNLQPLNDIHLKSHKNNEISQNARMSNLIILFMVGLYILIIACINFINLHTANFTTRLKEIGLKKIFGISKLDLFKQFFIESFFMSFSAVVISLLLFSILLPQINLYAQKYILLQDFINLKVILYLFSLSILIAFMASIYPYFFYAKMSRNGVSNWINRNVKEKSRIRSILLVFQLIITFVVIIFSSVFNKQMNLFNSKSLGFNKENIILIPVSNSPTQHNFEAFKNELLKNSNIEYVTAIDNVIGVDLTQLKILVKEESGFNHYSVNNLFVRNHFFEAFKIKVVKGRPFILDSKNDMEHSVIVNKSFVEQMGWDIEETLGKTLLYDEFEKIIVGVIGDVQVRSLHEAHQPLIINLFNDYEFTRYIAIKLKYQLKEHKAELVYIKDTWGQFEKIRPMEFEYLDVKISMLYDKDSRIFKSIMFLTLISILLTFMGVLGVVSHQLESKKKSIGIRKVLGASIPNLLLMLLKEYYLLISISSVIGFFVAFYSVKEYLHGIANKTEVGWTIYLNCALSIFIIGTIIISLWTMKYYRVSPLESLREE